MGADDATDRDDARVTTTASTGASAPPVRPIVKATDLGSVQVLKHANLFLLTDAFGDIHHDRAGLGLYHGDTRLLSCSVLRVAGERPVLLQASVGGELPGRRPDDQSGADRNPDDKVHPPTS